MNTLRGMNITWSTYQKVDSAEEVFLKEQDTETESHTTAVIQSYRKRIALISGAAAFFFICTIVLLITLIFKRPTDKQCGIQTSIWSPANEAIEYEVVGPQNPFAHKSPYRGPPTPELETAWDDLWLHGSFRFPEDKLHLINRTVDLGNDRSLKPWHDGKGGFHGQLEVYHQLHCLNLIRQYTWRDWYFRHPEIVRMSGDMLASDIEARMHTDHCIEALRLAIMCNGDTTPSITILNPKAPRGEMADFSPIKKCRKFDKLREWSIRNQANHPPAVDWRPRKKPDGIPERIEVVNEHSGHL
ncbi:hypothetical protein O1611_g8458 [Lasiodiplodia mahajangana]|uniref:Uncharacterized protein n=1 Tax=Lasiodiplodia mahajangana TaxID=1108764 RepID=A0ACC2JD43_9PEZI|nr:hypothetical protein O1611_g8458 [Lasiodiplodia mahajangana]